MRVPLPVACLAFLLPQLAPSLGTVHAADLDYTYGAPPPPPPVYERHVYRQPPPDVYDVPVRPRYRRPYYARPYYPYAGAYRDGFYGRPYIYHPPYPRPYADGAYDPYANRHPVPPGYIDRY